MYGERVSERVRSQLRNLGAAFTFLNTGRLSPWRGTMGSLVGALGGRVDALQRPPDVLKVVKSFEQFVLDSRPQ